jgi:hypothetical protein
LVPQFTEFFTIFEPKIWDNNHNCYSYAWNDRSNYNWDKQQPGANSNHTLISVSDYNCPKIIQRVLDDNKFNSIQDCQINCPNGYRKIALAVDPNRDYHFYRQDNNNKWSHKLGGNSPLQLNKDQQPWNIDRHYGDYNYTNFCSCLCIKDNNTLFT